MSDLIQLRGLRATGVHGVLPEERTRAQPFEVDVYLEVDLRTAGASDDLADTVDYGSVAEAVSAEISGPHADLLEHLAERIARAAMQAGGSRVQGVTVSLHKLRPPVPVHLHSAGVRLQRRRADLLQQ
ncbi:MAG: dihydroneopterin aldolase [Acidimicrobiales bacterium]|nr:dihydroneopterin aldolase [Acidimicrobiales bacterium]